MSTREAAIRGLRHLTSQELLEELLARDDDPILSQLSDEQLLAELTARCGNPTGAVLRVAQLAGVAVNYQDREGFEGHLDVQFTDAEWEQVRPLIGGYDQRVDDVWGVSDAVLEWMMEQVREAELDLDALQKRREDQLAAAGQQAATAVRSCRVCGCTDNRACTSTGQPCSWAGPDLCTTCVAVTA